MRVLHTFALLLAVALGCAGAKGGVVSTPAEARVDVRVPALAVLDETGRALLERHLAAHPHWSMREDARPTGTCRYAYRKEPSAGGPFEPPAGTRDVSLNGFYASGSGEMLVQTRVLLALGCEHGFGRAPDNLVRAGADAGATQLRVEEGAFGTPGAASYLVVEGGAGVRLEVYEQAATRARPFTTRAIAEVGTEIATVLANAQELTTRGYVSALMQADGVRTGAPSVVIDDGMQPGIYVLRAWANPGAPGTVHVRARFDGPPAEGAPRIPEELRGKKGAVLSEERMVPRTRGGMGWGADPTVLFPYTTELTVYEGGWDDLYRARFEVVFRGEDGAERVLVEGARDIAGWQQ